MARASPKVGQVMGGEVFRVSCLLGSCIRHVVPNGPVVGGDLEEGDRGGPIPDQLGYGAEQVPVQVMCQPSGCE